MAHVAFDESGIGATNLGQRLAGCEMDHLVYVQAFVRLAPTKHGNVNHDCYLRLYSGSPASRGLFMGDRLINTDCRGSSKFVEWSHAADAVPGIFRAGRFALAFIALGEARHEEFL